MMNEKEFTIFCEQTKEALGGIVVPSFQAMENGEFRTRMTCENISNPFSYIRVEMPEKMEGGWQNAHYHRFTIETWLIEKGYQIIIEEIENSEPQIIVMRPGDIYSSSINRRHNCYVSSGAITHTIKTTIANHTDFKDDWIFAQELDEYSKKLDIISIKKKYHLE